MFFFKSYNFHINNYLATFGAISGKLGNFLFQHLVTLSEGRRKVSERASERVTGHFQGQFDNDHFDHLIATAAAATV